MFGWLVYDDTGKERNEWFIKQMIGYAKKCCVELRLVRAEEILPGIKNGKPSLFTDLPLPDFAIVRTISPLLSKTLEECGVRVFNSAECSRIFNDKRYTHDELSALDLPMADCFFMNKIAYDAHIPEYPCVIKAPAGHGGKEVFLAHDQAEAESIVQKLNTNDFLVQKLVDKGRDVRVYLLEGKILSAVLRTSSADFRSNFSLGGKAELYEPDALMKDVVTKVYKRYRPLFVGVDFTFQNGMPILNEIEDVVGTRMLYSLTDIPVHERFLDAVFARLEE